jgi:hypothetical protein
MESSNLPLVLVSLYNEADTNLDTAIDKSHVTPSQYTLPPSTLDGSMYTEIQEEFPEFMEGDDTGVDLSSPLGTMFYIEYNESGSWHDVTVQKDTKIPYPPMSPIGIVDGGLHRKWNANTDLSLLFSYDWISSVPLLHSFRDYLSTTPTSIATQYASTRIPLSWNEGVQADPGKETANPDGCLLANISIEDLVVAGHIQDGDGSRSRYCNLNSGVVSADSSLFVGYERVSGLHV